MAMTITMNTTFSSSLTQLEILGFDRVGFVEEVTRFTSDYGRIVSVKFEADGVRSEGFVRIKLDNNERLESLLMRLKAITGLVKVKTTGVK
jgi:ACT domain